MTPLLLYILSHFLLANRAFGFQSSFTHSPQLYRQIRPIASVSAAGKDDESQPNDSPLDEGSDSCGIGKETKRMRSRNARIGGRRSKPRITRPSLEEESSKKNNLASLLSNLRMPTVVLLAFLLLRIFFAGGETPSYYYSYQSTTVYESRTYVSDGEIKTSSTESRIIKSNFPDKEPSSIYSNIFSD